MDHEARRSVVILSTEPWGKMLLSKMHYAIELVRMGYKVFFVNPPKPMEDKRLAVVAEEMEEGNLVIMHLNTVRGSLFYRHKLPFLFRQINCRYIRAIRKIAGADIDQVWSFNPNVFVDLRLFGARRSILLLYDLYQGRHVTKAAASADVIISISQLILDVYRAAPPPKRLIQHGLGRHFSGYAAERLRHAEFSACRTSTVKVGYVGNLLRAGMNTEAASRIIRENPEAEFHFWGPHSRQDNNVTTADAIIQSDLEAFIGFLRQQNNVFLHGIADQPTLAKGIFDMDMFLFLYSPRKDLNAASNAHKLVEYLSTGKVVVSTHVSNYAGTTLLEMCGKEEEEKLPGLFKEVVGHLSAYNSADRHRQRIDFALENTYVRQVDRILQFAGR
jgi:hypothetical protein